jgi:hypothetical protein
MTDVMDATPSTSSGLTTFPGFLITGRITKGLLED